MLFDYIVVSHASEMLIKLCQQFFPGLSVYMYM